MESLRLGTGSLLLAVLAILGLTTVTGATPSSKRSVDSASHSNYYNNLSAKPAVRWQTDPFSACSAPCGGGVQHRLIRCVREDFWSPGQITEVPAAQCPGPIPEISQPCNTHMCMGRWKRGPWTPCSVTCGVGIQEREVKCESAIWQGHRFQVSHAECGGRSPDKSRKCHLRDCPYTNKLIQESILSENYTLVQIKRARKLKLNIGGTVKILRGQTVVVKCPVRHYSRRLVYWSKGFKLVPFSGRVRATNGGLRIQKADPKRDEGVYTCIAGDKTATINVQFTSKGDPLSRTYRLWARKSRRRYRRRYPNSLNGQERNRGRKDVVVTSHYIPDGRQRDQSGSSNRTQPLTYVTGAWTECSVTCGSGGERWRKVFCSHVTSSYVKMVSDEECGRQGLKKPDTKEACLKDTECPVWRPGPWSKCHPSCGVVGYTNRILVCEWERSGTPAWNTCDISKKPATRKPCKLTPCTNCQDKSRYCSLARQLQMCRFKHFRDDCCMSCKGFFHKSHSNKSSKKKKATINNSNNDIIIVNDNNTS